MHGYEKRLCVPEHEIVWTSLPFLDLGAGRGRDVNSREAKGKGDGKEAFLSEGGVIDCDFMKHNLVAKALLERMISEYATLFSREGF